MAGLENNWFNFESKEEREERRNAYEKKMFPVEGSKEYVENLLKDCISYETEASDKLFQYLQVLGALQTEKEESRARKLKEWFKNGLVKKWPVEEKAKVIAIAKLMHKATTVEELPDQSAVEAEMKYVLEHEINELQSGGLFGFLKRK